MQTSIVCTISPEQLESMISAAVIKAMGNVTPPTPAKEPEDEWGSRQEGADVIRCSLPTLHGLISQGLVQTAKVGRRTLINLSDLRRKVKSGEIRKYKHR